MAVKDPIGTQPVFTIHNHYSCRLNKKNHYMHISAYLYTTVYATAQVRSIDALSNVYAAQCYRLL